MPLPPALHLRIFLPFAFGYFLSYLYRTVTAVLAPHLVRDLGIDPAGLGLLTSAYFFSFALFQLPLGVLLDRYGPRRVEAALLVFAAAGALLFARAETLGGLLLGRALIGLGVSACLMAAFKAFSQWFPPERLPLANGIQMISGGAGALAATAPVELALGVTDWRGCFLLLAAATLLAALAIFTLVPEKSPDGERERLAAQFAGIRTVFGSRIFWRITPWAVAGQAAFQAMVGLWGGPWLRDVGGFGPMAAANVLMGGAAAMVVGYFAFGALAERLGRRGIAASRVAAAGMSAFLLVQLFCIAPPAGLIVPLWLLFGFLGTAGILPYAVLTRQFPPTLAGRVNTGLNLLVFAGAFVVQWGVGVLVGLWPQGAAGGYAGAGYAWSFGILAALQCLGALWYRLAPAGKAEA